MSKFGEALGAAAENDPGAFGQVAQGLTQFGTSLIGGRARRKEQKAAGQWSARKAQMLAKAYKAAGGGYKN